MGVLFDSGIFSAILPNSAIAEGATLAWYASGTSTPLATYSDEALTTPNANPVTVSADGRIPPIWLQNAEYKLVFKPDSGTTITRDPIVGTNPAANLAASSGSSLVGFIQSGTGATARTVQSKLRDFVSVEDFGAVGNGTTDDYAAFNAALNSGARKVYALKANYKLNSTLVIPAGVELEGGGPNGTTWTVGANVTAVRLLSYSKLVGFKIQFPGGHSHTGVEAGDLTNFADRCIIEELYVNGSGLAAIQVRNGNAGSIRDVTCITSTGYGIEFTTETTDNNAWRMEGHIDLRGCPRGLSINAGSSASDPNASKSHSGDFIIVQNNSQYGVYVGTRSNKLTIYAEADTTADIFLDTYAYGNDITILEAGTLTDNGQANLITTQNADADYKRAFRGQPRFQGGAGKGWYVDSTDGTAGNVSFQKTAARQYDFIADGSSADATFRWSNAVGGFKANLEVDGTLTVQDMIALGLAGAFIKWGTGSPAGVVAAPLGSLYVNLSGGTGTTLYVKEAGTTGSSGWVAK